MRSSGPCSAAPPGGGRRRAHRRGRPAGCARPSRAWTGPGRAGRPGSVTRPPRPRWMPGSGTGSGWSAPATRSGPASSTCWATARPWALWVRGEADLRFACLRSVSIVGTRAATAYGIHVTTELAAALAERGWTVVSGGAFGIDSQAHRGALAAEGVTVAVLPSGLDVPYPRGPPRAVPGHRRARGTGQRAAAGPDADPARVPGPQPADRRAQPRDRDGRGGAAQRGAEHGPARPGPEPPADGRARPGDVPGLGRLPPGHPGLGSRVRHRRARRARLPVVHAAATWSGRPGGRSCRGTSWTRSA